MRASDEDDWTDAEDRHREIVAREATSARPCAKGKTNRSMSATLQVGLKRIKAKRASAEELWLRQSEEV